MNDKVNRKQDLEWIDDNYWLKSMVGQLGPVISRG
jgi:hypothetical protein